MSKKAQDILGITLITFCVSDLVMAFTLAALHDYCGKFQQLQSVANCFFPINLLF